jgi:lipoate-protein ligase A
MSVEIEAQTGGANTSTAAWRVLPATRAPAAEQLARSEALLREVATGAAPPTLRWYGYDTPALILGVGQPPDTVDAALAGRAGLTVVKRTSGGTVVLADETLLALDVALPATHPLAGTDVLAAYGWLGETFRDALAALVSTTPPASAGPSVVPGISLVSVERARADQVARRSAPPDSDEYLRGLACFGTLSPFEVALSGAGRPDRKLVGLSQVRRRGVVLFQAGVYTTIRTLRHRLLAALLALPEAQRATFGDALARRMAGLDDLIPAPPHAAALCRLVEQGAAARAGMAATD